MKKIFLLVLLFQIVTGTVYPASAYAQPTDNSRFVFTELTARDTVSGLVWTIDANPAGKGLSWADVSFFLRTFNTTKYAQCDHWRAPELEELRTLVKFGKQMGITKGFDAFLIKAGFKNVKGQNYWTSTVTWIGKEDEPGRKVLNLYSAGENEDTQVATMRSYDNYLWPVCSEQK